MIDKNVAALLRNLNATPGLPAVRFVSANPDDEEPLRGQGMYAADGSFRYVGDDKRVPGLRSVGRGHDEDFLSDQYAARRRC